jgi:hypothetical protein
VLYAQPWARFAYGMLPRRMIATLRASKRRRWVARNPNLLPS